MDKNEHVVEILTNQLPTYFRPIIEFQEIMKAHGCALEELKKAVAHMINNFYIISCDGQTLSGYEALLGITKTNGLSIEERRAVVLAQYSMRFLYTLPALKEMLSLAVGAKHYSVTCLYGKYQLIVKIMEQELSLVKETYNMVSLIKPAHIELVLFAEYQGAAKVKVRPEAAITFTMAFYPQFNRPELFLDNTWNLNGDMELSGYHMDGRVELYPVGIKLLAAARAAPKEETGIVFLSGAEGAVSSSQQTGMCVPAMCREAAKESIVVQAEAEVDAGGGAVLMDNLNCLDDEWKLDGGRELNGGTYWL